MVDYHVSDDHKRQDPREGRPSDGRAGQEWSGHQQVGSYPGCRQGVPERGGHGVMFCTTPSAEFVTDARRLFILTNGQAGSIMDLAGFFPTTRPAGLLPTQHGGKA